MSVSVWRGLGAWCLLAALCIPASTLTAQHKPVGGIEIPEGTTMVVHLFGWNGGFAVPDTTVFQVDQDVVVHGVVVVQRGSLGAATFDRVEQGEFRRDFGVVTYERPPFSPVHKHEYGPKKKGVIRYIFSCHTVLSVASTLLEVDPSANVFDVDHQNATYGEYGIDADIDAEFTVKLKHAVVTIPQ